MANERIRELGLKQLALMGQNSLGLSKWKTWLTDYQFNDEYADDSYVWLTCVLALKAVGTGNFGVGCILIDNEGKVIVQGHNRVFEPYFRSDRHGEMVVMDEFEDSYPEITSMEGYTIYTSLEPCPMCLARLITSGINLVLYAASDNEGGMVHKMNDLPPVWGELAKRHVFSRANCSRHLTNAANQIFLINANELNEKLRSR